MKDVHEQFGIREGAAERIIYLFLLVYDRGVPSFVEWRMLFNARNTGHHVYSLLEPTEWDNTSEVTWFFVSYIDTWKMVP